MSLLDLSKRPALAKRTHRLVRLNADELVVLLCHSPAYFPSHWRSGHTFPCMAPILSTCPWCKACQSRDHAYVAGVQHRVQGWTEPVVIEMPPQSLHDAMERADATDLHSYIMRATRRYSRAPLHVDLKEPEKRHDKTIDHDAILRTLCKVYALPDPDAFPTTGEWKLACELRTNHADYTPARRQSTTTPH